MDETMEKYDIVCIGTALLDSIIRGYNPEPVSASGYTAEEEGSLFLGGEGVNEALALAKLGVKTGLLCFLGRDIAGAVVEQGLKEAGVSTEFIQWQTEHATPITTMFVNKDGSRKSVTNLSHRYNFHPERNGLQSVNAKALILGSLFRAPFDDPAVIHAVLTYAKEKEMRIFADTKIPNFHALGLEDVRDSLPLIDYITPNENEARYYTGKEQLEDMADVFLQYGVSNVIIKLGSEGCFFRNAEETIRLPAFPIDAVDSTGAGDNFIAGFASEILNGSPLKEALLFATACGAICTTAMGAGTALKDKKQVLDFLDRRCVR